MQAKDILDLPVLAFVAQHGGIGCNWYADAGRSVRLAMPADVPPKLALAKMRVLISRGLVSGCPCGCRGDFEITDKGKALLAAPTIGDTKSE